MINFKDNRSEGSSWIKWLMLAAAVILVAYCLPRDNKNQYNYEENRPWAYSLLTAPFDIPVRLDSVSAQMVKDSIDRTFEPVYQRDYAADKTVVAEVSNRLESNPAVNLTPGERNQMISLIRKVYEQGIVNAETYEKIQSGRLPSVKMIHDNTTVSIPTRGYLSAREAYSRIDSLLRDQRFHAAIMAVKLPELLNPNVEIDSVNTSRLLADAYQKALAPIGVIQQGERIIDRGDIVTAQLYTILRTYEELGAERGGSTVKTAFYVPLLAKILFLLLLYGALYGYLIFFRNDYFTHTRTMGFIMLVTVGFTVFAYGMLAAFTSGLYLVPFTIVAVVVLVFLDSRTAFFCYMISVLACAVSATFPFEFIFVQWLAGVATIISIKEMTKRSELIRTAALVFVCYSLGFVAVELLQSGSLSHLSPRMFGYFGINAVFISFAYIMVFLLEKVFGFTSRVTLVELSDINHPLLKALSEECPGTFQHSMAVSNLATAAANRIGAKVQLVRAGALYHDIGKISNPAFFTENQHGVNPHDALNPIQSAGIIIGHVTDGLRRAEKHKLPAVIRNFISTHHGRGRVRYFFTRYCNAHPGEEVDPAPFTYPGPNPNSRETSILMMADAVEAASRSMSDHSPESVRNLVNRIIDTQINEGLHNDSPISFRDVNAIKDEFASRLVTMFHGRIPYPELQKNAAKAKETV